MGYKHSEETKRKIGFKHKGKIISPESKQKMREAKIGFIPWNKGLKGIHCSPATEFKKGNKLTPQHKANISKYANPLKGEHHPKWKGDKASYRTIHEWVQNNKGKPAICTFCPKTTGMFHWANISHLYKRELEDWMRLCASCHRKYDFEYRKLLHDNNK